MRIGFVIQNQGDGALQSVKVLAPFVEKAGFHSVWLTDHVVGVRAFADHGYGPYWLEALTSLGYMAAQTSTIMIGTSILVLPIRDPVYTAKVLSTLDNLSDGRLVVGVGSGWSRAEFHALGRGAFHDRRGAVTNESLDLIMRCWQGGAFEWQGEFFSVRHAEFEPAPVQKPHPRLLIGGPAVKAIAARIKRTGGAWHPAMSGAVDRLRGDMATMNDLVGRDVSVTVRLILSADTTEAALFEYLSHLDAIGCEEAIVDFRPAESLAAQSAAERAISAYRRLRH